MTHGISRDRLDQALDRIADPNGQGARARLTVYREAASAAGAADDHRRLRIAAAIEKLWSP